MTLNTYSVVKYIHLLLYMIYSTMTTVSWKIEILSLLDYGFWYWLFFETLDQAVGNVFTPECKYDS